MSYGSFVVAAHLEATYFVEAPGVTGRAFRRPVSLTLCSNYPRANTSSHVGPSSFERRTLSMFPLTRPTCLPRIIHLCLSHAQQYYILRAHDGHSSSFSFFIFLDFFTMTKGPFTIAARAIQYPSVASLDQSTCFPFFFTGHVMCFKSCSAKYRKTCSF